MHRHGFIDLLRTYRPQASVEEQPVLMDLVEFVKSTPTCFERQHEAGAIHLCASMMLVSHDMEKALMLHHTKLNKWLNLGGHMDGNPDAIDSALREVEEECGITGVSIYRNAPYDVARFHFEKEFGYPKTIYDVRFLGMAPQSAVESNLEPKKAGELRWVTPEEAYALAGDNEHMIRLISKWEKIRLVYQSLNRSFAA